MERCSRCGNEIPEWAHGVCPVCVRIGRDEKRYGKRSRSKSRPSFGRSEAPQPVDSQPVQSTIAPLPSQKHAADQFALSKPPSNALRLRLDGINDLLKDTYGSKVRISDLLVKQGIPHEKIERWRKDELWLTHFLKRLQRKLIQDWVDLLPGEDLRILGRWYGLGKARVRSLQAIADEFGMTPTEAKFQLSKLQRFLRGRTGRVTLEKAIVASVGKGVL